MVRPSGRMSWNLLPTLVEAIEELAPQEQNGCQPLRVLVQCLLPVDGRQAILGRVTSGRLTAGQVMTFSPGSHQTTVASVLLGQREVGMATAGQSVGLLLGRPVPVERGHVGFNVDYAPLVTDRFPARVFWIGSRPLKVHNRIEVLCGTQGRWGYAERVTKVIDPISLESNGTDAGQMDDSQVAETVIRTDMPMCIDRFDVVQELGRLAILQDGGITGGGVITG